MEQSLLQSFVRNEMNESNTPLLTFFDEKIQSLLTLVDEGFFVLDAQLLLVYANPRAEEYLMDCYNFKGGLGSPVLPFLPDQRRNDLEQYFRQVLNGRRITYEFEVPSKTNEFKWLECCYFPLVDKEGKIIGIGGTLKDITEQQQYKLQLQQQSKELTNILNSITDGFFTMDRQWIIRYANPQACEIMGVDVLDATGKNIWDLFPEAKDSAFFMAYQKAFVSETQVHLEEYYEPLNKWLDLTIYSSRDLLSVYFRDITDKKKKEQQLEEANLRYELVSMATSEAIWEWQIGSENIFWHGENYKKVFGYPIVNQYESHRQWRENLHPADRKRMAQRYEEAIKNGDTYWSDQYWFQKANGEVAYVKDCAYIVRNAAGEPVRMIGAMSDITEQKKAEEALVQSEYWYRLLFFQSAVPQIIFEKESLQIKEANDAALNMYGYTRSEFLNITLLHLKPEADHQIARKMIGESIATEPPSKGTRTHIKKNGEQVIIEVFSAPIFYQGKESRLATLIDVTDKIRLEEELLQLKLSEQNMIVKATLNGQEKERELIGAELHDNINQVLTTTKLYLELAHDKEEYRQDLIKRSEQNITTIINEIRFLCKTLTPSSIKDVGLIASIKDLIDSYSITQKFTIHFSFDGELPVMKQDFKVNLFRIVQEKLNNISKYAEARNIWINLTVEDQNLILKVNDDGKGFNPRNMKSNGIGLMNIKNRCELYNGKMTLQSAPGEGCALQLVFPLQ